MRLLGVIYDSMFNFEPHVTKIIAKSKQLLYWLEGMKHEVHAEKIKIFYESLILSRVFFACEAYYPYISLQLQQQLERIHARGCKIITGLMNKCSNSGAMHEAGYRQLKQEVQERIYKITNKLLHFCPTEKLDREHSFGMKWLVRLIRNEPMITASNRWTKHKIPVKNQQNPDSENYIGVIMGEDPQFFPPTPLPDARFMYPTLEHDQYSLDADNEILSSRDIFVTKMRAIVPTVQRSKLGDPHPCDPSYLSTFGHNLKFISAPPGNLKKPKPEELEAMTDEQRQEVETKFKKANEQRLNEIEQQQQGKSLWVFADASRDEKKRKCAGHFAIFDNKEAKGKPIIEKSVSGGELACIYTGEITTALSAAKTLCFNESLIKNIDNINIILDSQSILRAEEVTYVRPMNRLEQLLIKKLVWLSHRENQKTNKKLNVVLSFIFSHYGIKGNEYVDEMAKQACEEIGNLSNPFQTPYYDVWREIKK